MVVVRSKISEQHTSTFHTFIATAQTNQTDEKLLVKYSQKELKTMKTNDPKAYHFAAYCVDNAYYIANFSKEKAKQNPSEFGTISIKDLTQINFYALNIELKEKDYQAFVIEGTDKLLMVKSKDKIHQELKLQKQWKKSF